MKRWFLLGFAFFILVGLIIPALRPIPPFRGRSGTVVDDAGNEVADATVRVQGTSVVVETDDHGEFQLLLPRHLAGRVSRVTAAKPGFIIAGIPSNERLHFELRRLPSEDSEGYAWVDPSPDTAEPKNCGTCHEAIHKEWSAAGHARSATNRHFLNVYDGSVWNGKNGTGWNLLAEHPDGAGVCTSCHAPTVAFDDPAYDDLRKVRGVDAQGIHCDFCHKIAAVNTDQFGLTHGRFAFRLLRPKEGQLTFGPLDDVDRGEDAFAPIYKDSRYCAACHEGTVFGVPVYTTYSEWLESPARKGGKECQDCHMRNHSHRPNFAPGHGGIERDPRTLSGHDLFSGDRAHMLRESLRWRIDIEPSAPNTEVAVELTAPRAGHRWPTGFSDRNLILIVEARSEDDRPLSLQTGPILQERAGRSVAKLPGKLFAKQLEDFDGHANVPFWRARPEVKDTRLLPDQPDRSIYRFPAGLRTVRVRLLHRRFWEDVAREKGWPDNETVILDRTFTAPADGPMTWVGP